MDAEAFMLTGALAGLVIGLGVMFITRKHKK
jgi:hypothetical protein